ncbi:MAG TPA: rhodanese-like domain-containing protein, partial [Candidatus Methylomirabilis sp.]|nr:rhodanese-like domain-containing protein [Candidatus Methylomirabilis sp.]
MRAKRYFPLVLIGILVSLASGTLAAPAGAATSSGKGYARPELLAETDWLAQHLGDANLRIVDLRSQEAYTAGHIPGAVRLDGTKLDDPKTGYVPLPESFAALMAGLGIGDRTRVVAYDDLGGLWATRLWW